MKGKKSDGNDGDEDKNGEVIERIMMEMMMLLVRMMMERRRRY